MNKDQFLLKLKKFNEKISVSIPKNFIMIGRTVKDRYIFYESTIIYISIINDKYFEDRIIEVETPFEDFRDEPTKEITNSK